MPYLCFHKWPRITYKLRKRCKLSLGMTILIIICRQSISFWFLFPDVILPPSPTFLKIYICKCSDQCLAILQTFGCQMGARVRGLCSRYTDTQLYYTDSPSFIACCWAILPMFNFFFIVNERVKFSLCTYLVAPNCLTLTIVVIQRTLYLLNKINEI